MNSKRLVTLSDRKCIRAINRGWAYFHLTSRRLAAISVADIASRMKAGNAELVRIYDMN
jgi:hypothetical protein